MTEAIRHELDQSLPAEMQGRWVDVEEPGAELVIDGSSVTYCGQAVQHEHFVVSQVDGAVCVDLGIDHADRADSFARDNLTNLVIDPDGNFHAYNVKFAAQFMRAA